ncbi:MAG: glutamate-5-semialdehyde dehydrogenase [Solirubrobacterales bacterium]|nr:glutamate-5-semialdehyde dehydrogenase [Solirubrobacterales bacterium]
MAIAVSSVAEVCAGARRASRALAALDSATRNRALEAIAAALEAREGEIVEANRRDVDAGEEAGLGDALLDRLRLDPQRVRAIAAAVRAIAALGDPVGEVIEGRRLENGLQLRRVRVPLGVIAVVFEARPNVAIDATALCVKSGNAIVLRGSSSAAHSNAVLVEIAARAASEAGLPHGSINLIAGGGREELAELASCAESVDLVIPRGGEGLKRALQQVATVPVIYAASGNCHVYVDAAADLEMAEEIAFNAKVQRPGVCNAAETLLVHEAVAAGFLPAIAQRLTGAGVVLRADERTRALLGETEGDAERDAERGGEGIEAAVEEDFATEYLGMTMAVGVVDSLEEAIDHIARFGSGHSEAIVTRDLGAARAFQMAVDAACVYVNASTRFTDGGEFGMGAEIGNSTQKLHARGPIGLRELCTYKYLIDGDGQIRA